MKRSKLKRYVVGAVTFATALSIGFIFQYGDAIAARLGVEAPVAGPSTTAILQEAPELVPVSAAIATSQALIIPSVRVREIETLALSSVPIDISVPAIAAPSAEEPALVLATAALDQGTVVELDEVGPELTPELVEFDIEADVALPSSILAPTVLKAPETAPTLAAPVKITEEADIAEEVVSCDVKAHAIAQEMAMVGLFLDAPCHAEQPFIVHHQGMSVSVKTDDMGLAEMTIPALNENALFILSFEDGSSAMAETFVADMSDFDRAVLKWQGRTNGFELHAMEFGATYGTAGHIWHGSEFAPTETSGFLTSFVDGDHAAEIYTYPSGKSSGFGDILLSVEAKITEANCNQDVAAQAIQIGPNRSTSTTNLEMKMPDCASIGEFLVLKNMFEDLTLASR